MTGNERTRPNLIVLGIIRKAVGREGACAFQAFGPTLRTLALPVTVYIGGNEDSCRRSTLDRVEFRLKGPVCFFREVTDAETADAMRGLNLYLEYTDLPQLEDGSYYQFELAGMKVQTDSGREIGSVERIDNFPTVDSVLVRRNHGESLMIPLTAEALVAIDRTTGFITVRESFLEELL